MPDPDETTNVLVVDDLPEKLLAYRSILDELGQNLVTVTSGEEALREVLRRDFAVILLDVHMPPGMSGLETAALIRKRRRSAHTPIIFLTAFADEVRAAEGYAHGAVDYIPTPVVPEILRAKVRVFVDLYRMTQQVKRQAEERIALAEERSKREAAEEANRRLAFVARAGVVLGQSLDHDATARDVALFPVPFLADAAALVVPHPRTGTRKAVLARAEEGGPVLAEGTGRELLPPELAGAIERVLAGAGGEPAAGDAAIALPLRARGQTFAALGLSRAASGRPFAPADLTVAEAVASRAAIALDNARLYKDVETADRQKNEFLSMLAHELRNPLAPIRNAAEVLRLSGSDHPKIRWARDVIDRQLGHLVRLVDDLLDVSRITRGKIRLKPERVDLAQVVGHAVEASRPMIERARHQLEVTIPEGPVWVNGDPTRLTQVFTNLLNNAAKYTEEGGRIWLTVTAGRGARSAEPKPEDAGAGPSFSEFPAPRSEFVEVRVRDTGIGIPPDLLSAVFDLFTQADRSLDRAQGGLGVGLTLVKRLVEMHGGTVEARSDGPGTGSEFVVRLPAAGPADAPPVAAGEHHAPARLRVVVVDDSPNGAEGLGTLLALAGHDVRTARDGPSAIETAVRFRPDVVLLDVGVPGIDGYEVARQLRARRETRPAVLVALSGNGPDEDRRLTREAGFDHHFAKPVEFRSLQTLLTSLRSAGSPPPA